MAAGLTAPIPFDALFAHPRNAPASVLHEMLNLDTLANPLGDTLKVDDRQTGRKRIFAVGDLVNPMVSVTGGRYLRPALDHRLTRPRYRAKKVAP